LIITHLADMAVIEISPFIAFGMLAVSPVVSTMRTSTVVGDSVQVIDCVLLFFRKQVVFHVNLVREIDKTGVLNTILFVTTIFTARTRPTRRSGKLYA